MKQSRYAITAEGAHGEHLLFNTATETLAVAGGGAWQTFNTLPSSRDAEEPKQQENAGPAPGGEEKAQADRASNESEDASRREAALAQLAAAGFAVDDDADEIAGQEASYRAAQQDRSTLALCLAPTYACNLRCPYCYEKGSEAAWNPMDERVMRAVVAFVDAMYERNRFTRLEIQWYGGDPSLALDVVEALSRMLMTWCDEHDVAYSAMMLSNCTRIGADEAAHLSRCAVEEMLVTIDGPEEVHNVRRPAVDGSNSYQGIMRAVDELRSQGIRINALINLDKKTEPLLDALHDALRDEHGVDLKPTKLNDYHRTYGCGAFAQPAFDLFTHEEYARFSYEHFASRRHTSDDYAALLAPAPLFCRGQMENYYGIDAEGDVYKCDGWMGDGRHVLFNLLDGYDASALDTAPVYPFDDAECTACELLPICKGTCQWERTCCGNPCHPLKTTIGDYLRDWHACIEEEKKAARTSRQDGEGARDPHPSAAEPDGIRILHTVL